uniref:Uncharacterized protein n=1 Tax=Oryza punctata TaxID=4537 RepID=A0A0E0JVL6_ORYPU
MDPEMLKKVDEMSTNTVAHYKSGNQLESEGCLAAETEADIGNDENSSAGPGAKDYVHLQGDQCKNVDIQPGGIRFASGQKGIYALLWMGGMKEQSKSCAREQISECMCELL